MKRPHVRENLRSETSRFYVDFRSDGKRKRTFFSTRAEAEDERKRIENKLKRDGQNAMSLSDDDRIAATKLAKDLKPYHKTIRDAGAFYLKHLADSSKSVTVAALVTEYLDHKKRIGSSEIHQKDLRNRYNAFCADHGATTTRDLTAKQVQEWLYGLKVVPLSVNNFRSRLGALFGFAVKRGYMDANPIEAIDKIKVVGKPPEIYSVDDLAALLVSAPPDIIPLIAIGAFAGIRTYELLRLSWEDIDLGRGFLNVTAAKAKTASRRNIRMEPNLLDWLRPYAGRTGELFVGANVYAYLYKIRVACKAAGVKEVKNGFRHSFCSYHIAKYGNAARLALDMGHTTTALIFSTYRELVTPEDAERYFAIRPAQPAENVISISA